MSIARGVSGSKDGCRTIFFTSTLSPPRRTAGRIEGCGKKQPIHRSAFEFGHPPLTESDTRQSRQTLSSLSLAFGACLR